MPDEAENPSNLPNRHRPHLSDLSKETTEDDLWDLDDAPPQAQKPDAPAKEKPAPRASTRPESRSGTGQEIKAEPRARPGKPAIKVAAKEQPPETVPEDEDELLWLDPEEAPLSDEPKIQESQPAARQGPREGSAKSHDPDPESPTTAAEELEGLMQEAEKVVSRSDEPAPGSKQGDPNFAVTGKSEKVGLIALALVLVAIAAWWLVSLFSSISTTRLGDNEPDFPAEGKYVTVSSGESYWREPVREGANRDIARPDVEFIPALTLELENSQSGVLRALFRDEQGDFIGDSISRSFANGVFEVNGNSSIEFPATDGFDNLGDFNGYRVGKERWTVELFEGPSPDAPGSEFKLLFTTQISTNRR